MSPWPIVPVSEIAGQERNALVGGPFGSNLVSADYVPVGVPVIRGQNMGHRWVSGEFAYVSEAKAEALSSNIARPDDIIFTQRGTLGQVALVPSGPYQKYIISQSQMKLTVDRKIAYPKFYYYVFSSQDQQEYIRSNAIQTGVPHTNLGMLRNTPVPRPKLHIQKGIADLLSSFDDKIELNQQINETLEGMAQTIFRDWFIDFGPVRRRQGGATDPVAIMGRLTPDPVRAAQLAALFPAAFGIDGLPVGWSRRTVESIMELAYGKSLPKTVRKGGPFPVYGSGGISGTHSIALVHGPGIIVGRKGTVGSLYWEAGDFFAIDTVFYVVPRDGVPLNFAWHLLRTLGLEGMNTDAAVPGLNRGNAYRLEFAFGGMPLLDAFDALAAPLRAKQNASNLETQTLAETRDYLLPRLMSGAVRVAPAETV